MSPMISVVILTKNEARHIRECVATATWAGEVLVLDSYSEDDTVPLAQAAGARVAQCEFVNFSDLRQKALQQAAGEWVFFLDADERVPPELAAEVQGIVAGSRAGGDSQPVGYWVPRRNYFFGHLVRHAGWGPDYQLRLLRRGRAHYDLAQEVHEVATLDGPDGYLTHPLIHYNYASWRQFFAKQNRYTQHEANTRFRQGVRVRPQNYVLQPWREFWRRYVTWQGYKDGWMGLALCAVMAYYNLVLYLRLGQMGRKAP
ncbi:MAG: glycosyltransferase family 2 protein [Chloroflexi bacterium]|nr:glycosyltransferase family 2 protein [Chloroflexota bacterium]